MPDTRHQSLAKSGLMHSTSSASHFHRCRREPAGALEMAAGARATTWGQSLVSNGSSSSAVPSFGTTTWHFGIRSAAEACAEIRFSHSAWDGVYKQIRKIYD